MTAHSEKEAANPTCNRWSRFHLLRALADHRPAESGEALVINLHPGYVGSKRAKDRIDVVKQAMAQSSG